jgi:uncharacterized OsmC-like protein
MSIGDAIASASAYLTEHPDEARYRDAAATARLVSGLKVEVTGTTGERLTTDMPKGIGGGATEPSPGWFLRAAQASCVAALIAIRAAATGVVIERLEVSVDSESDDRGILGLDPAIPAGPLSARVSVSIRARAPQASVNDIVEWGIDHCPVLDALRRPVPVEIEISAD